MVTWSWNIVLPNRRVFKRSVLGSFRFPAVFPAVFLCVRPKLCRQVGLWRCDISDIFIFPIFSYGFLIFLESSCLSEFILFWVPSMVRRWERCFYRTLLQKSCVVFFSEISYLSFGFVQHAAMNAWQRIGPTGKDMFFSTSFADLCMGIFSIWFVRFLEFALSSWPASLAAKVPPASTDETWDASRGHSFDSKLRRSNTKYKSTWCKKL